MSPHHHATPLTTRPQRCATRDTEVQDRRCVAAHRRQFRRQDTSGGAVSHVVALVAQNDAASLLLQRQRHWSRVIIAPEHQLAFASEIKRRESNLAFVVENLKTHDTVAVTPRNHHCGVLKRALFQRNGTMSGDVAAAIIAVVAVIG